MIQHTKYTKIDCTTLLWVNWYHCRWHYVTSHYIVLHFSIRTLHTISYWYNVCKVNVYIYLIIYFIYLIIYMKMWFILIYVCVMYVSINCIYVLDRYVHTSIPEAQGKVVTRPAGKPWWPMVNDSVNDSVKVPISGNDDPERWQGWWCQMDDKQLE